MTEQQLKNDLVECMNESGFDAITVMDDLKIGLKENEIKIWESVRNSNWFDNINLGDFGNGIHLENNPLD